MDNLNEINNNNTATNSEKHIEKMSSGELVPPLKLTEKKLMINMQDIDDDEDENDNNEIDINDIDEDDDNEEDIDDGDEDEADDDDDDNDYENYEIERQLEEDVAAYGEIIHDNSVLSNEDERSLNESINVELIKMLNRSSGESNEPLNLNLFKLQDHFRLFGNRGDDDNEVEAIINNSAHTNNTTTKTNKNSLLKSHQENEFDILDEDTSEANGLRKRLHAANLEILNLNNFINELNVDINKVKSESTNLQMKYSQLKFDNKELISQLRRISSEKEELIKELNNATASRLKSMNEAKRYKSDAEAIHREYTQIMSERDQVHKEMEALQEQLCKERDKIKSISCNHSDVEQLRKDLSAAVCDRDKALAELQSYCEQYGAIINCSVMQNSTGTMTNGALTSSALYETTASDSGGDLSSNNCSNNNTNNSSSINNATFDVNRNSNACLYDQFLSVKDEKILQENDNLKHEIRDLQQEIELAKKRRDWAFSERDKMVLERESIRALCDEIRHQRDKAISELAEALRESDELKKQNSIAMRQINMLEENLAMLSDKLNNSKYFYNRKTILVEFEMSENGDLGVEFTGAKLSDDAPHEDEEDQEDQNDQVNEFLIVTKVSKNGLAYGRLKENDHIFRINNVDVKDANYDQINHLLNNCEGTLTFLLTRQYIDKVSKEAADSNGEEDEEELQERAKGKKSARRSNHSDEDDDNCSRNNLLTIHKTTMDDLIFETGIYVSMVQPDSEANDCLDIGDRILSINGKNLTNRSLNDTLALIREISESCKDFNLVVLKRSTGNTSSYLMNEMMPPELNFSKNSLASSMSLENPIIKTTPHNNTNGLCSSTSSLNNSSASKNDEDDTTRPNESIEHLKQNSNENDADEIEEDEDDDDDDFYAVRELDCLLKNTNNNTNKQPKEEHLANKLNTWPKNTTNVDRTIMRGSTSAANHPQASTIKITKGNNECANSSSNNFFKAILSEIDIFKNNTNNNNNTDNKQSNIFQQQVPQNLDSNNDNKIVSSLMSKDYMNFVLCSGSKQTPKNKQPKLGQIRNIFIEKESESAKQLLGINISEARVPTLASQTCVFVSQVIPDSVAAKAGIFVGDQLLEICGVNLRMASYKEAAKVLTECSSNNLVNIIVKYDPNMFKLNKIDTNPTAKTIDEIAQLKHLNDDEDVLLKQLSQRRSSAPADNPFSVKYVLINNIFNKLQLRVAGGNAANEFFISEIKSNSVLQVGDQILEVNNVNVTHFTRERLAYELFYKSEYFSVANAHLKLTIKASDESEACFNKLEMVNNEPDSFYVLCMVNRRAKFDWELDLNKYEIYHVVNTMPHGFISGYWLAQLIHSRKVKSSGDKKRISGLIPSIGRLVNENACKIVPRTVSVENTPPQPPTKSNFFSKVIKSNSITSNLLNYSAPKSNSNGCSGAVTVPTPISLINSSLLTSNSMTTTTNSSTFYCDEIDYEHHMIDVELLAMEASGVAFDYRLVEMVDVGVKRPVLILGPLSVALIEYLIGDACNDFVSVGEDSMCDFERLNELIATTRHSRHVLFSFDASNCVNDLSVFKKAKVYPIVVLVKYKSSKLLNEFSMSLPTALERNFDAKTSLKMAKHMFKKASKVEKEFKACVTNTIDINNADFNSAIERIKSVIYHEQKRPIWVPISTENSKKTFENVFV